MRTSLWKGRGNSLCLLQLSASRHYSGHRNSWRSPLVYNHNQDSLRTQGSPSQSPSNSDLEELTVLASEPNPKLHSVIEALGDSDSDIESFRIEGEKPSNSDLEEQTVLASEPNPKLHSVMEAVFDRDSDSESFVDDDCGIREAAGVEGEEPEDEGEKRRYR